MVIESGWPASGQTLGTAVPSKQNQYIAVNSIIGATNGAVVVFEAFNDYWKAPGANGVENSFVYLMKGVELTCNRDCIQVLHLKKRGGSGDL
jgi:exo-beta-1,3-glucanase (GH17 family)